MAGRPTPGSTTGVLIGMISAFAVALIALVLLVVLWSNQEELRASEKKAVADAQLLMRSNEMQGALRAWVDAAGSRNSVSATARSSRLATISKRQSRGF